jgi:MerR family transcriptional regulator, thiopeptide resistance regulator
MKQGRTYQVKEVSRIAGVSIRTLHHYDEIGLLRPSGRTGAGYRLYSDDDLLRLQQIIIGRELGLPLEEIRRFIDDPRFDRKQALLSQRDQLQRRARQTEAMLRAIDAALAVLEPGNTGETMEMNRIFDGFDPSKYEEEAKQRWGHTDAYKESKRRTERYTAEDWEKLKADQVAIYSDAFAALKAGKSPGSPEAMDIAERHRQSIDRWFYPCSLAMHSCLADMYENDSRFAENIDRYGEGLTTFLVAAIRANARRQG